MGRQINTEYAILNNPFIRNAEEFQTKSYAITALATGSLPGTAKIPAGVRAVVVTSANANNAVVLPDPIVGTELLIYKPGATGFELRSNAPATVAINGGTGAGAESAVATGVLLLHAVCVSATAWLVNSRTASAAGNVMLEAAA